MEPPPPWLALQVSCIQNVIMILILMIGDRPLLVFTEWLAALAAEKQGEVMYCFRILTPDHDLQLHLFNCGEFINFLSEQGHAVQAPRTPLELTLLL